MAPGVIQPTFTCFDDAFEIILGIAEKDKARARRLILVHALCQLEPEKYGAHAWVEEGSKCLFAGIYDGTKVFCRVYRPEYYGHVQPVVMTKYTMEDAVAVGHVWGTSGPWEAKYCLFTKKHTAE